MVLEDKVFVVTGGGNGMGREIVLNLLIHLAKVVAIDVNAEALEETRSLAGELASNLMTVKADITDLDKLEELPLVILKKFGPIDGIINNAGIIQPFCTVKDIEWKVINRLFQINFFGTLNMIKVFLPYLLESKSGYIVNVSSMGGFLPIGGQSIYGASKAAVKLLSEGLECELKSTNVKVMTVFPGAMNTNIKKNSGLEVTTAEAEETSEHKAEPLSPIKAADEMITAIQEDKNTLFIGQDAIAMDMLYRKNPQKAVQAISERINHKL